ncbi:MAG: TonB-dependent receptor plug domain-containing protein [Candidatus Marinimicrobia bacterium]|nr:TonB-dependent receptor plug domain-containing protein [Candidatus Neomarinimicrobiota bacterium]
MNTSRYLLFLLLVITTSGLGQSNSKDLSEMTLEELMGVEVISASRYVQKLDEAPATMIIITQKQIIDNGYFDLSDIIKDLPGIDIVDNARGFGEFYTVRGIEGNDRFLVLMDGQKLNPASGTFLSVGNSISIRFAERVEILLGPGSVVYGADAFSGVITIINKQEASGRGIQAYVNTGSQSAIDAGVQLGKTISDNMSINVMARIFQSDGPDFSDKDSIFMNVQNYSAPLTTGFEQPLEDYNLLISARYKEINLSWYRQHFDEGNALGTHPKSNIYNRENRWKLTSDIVWVVIPEASDTHSGKFRTPDSPLFRSS